MICGHCERDEASGKQTSIIVSATKRARIWLCAPCRRHLDMLLDRRAVGKFIDRCNARPS